MKRPHFYTNLLNGDKTIEPVITEKDFDRWFNEHVEPINRMLSEGIEVWSDDWGDFKGEHMWSDKEDSCVALNMNTHKALLINIQPLKKETAEDVLRDLVSYCEEDGIPETAKCDPTFKLYNRAKAILERK